MASYPYNPYNDYRKIVGYKGDWHTAKQLGGDPNQYYEAAMPYYQSLYDNGYGELADALTASDYIQAKGLRDKYGLKPDEQFNTDYNMGQLTGDGTGAGSGNGNGAYSTGDRTDDRLLERATGYDETYKNLVGTAADIASGKTAPGLSPAVQNIYDSWLADQDRLNGEIRYDANGNVVSGLNTEHYNIGKNQLDHINNFDVTKQPYYQGIMDQYRLGGQDAANAAYASGAASNAGNIDSYAAANANRQQLAFTNAGQQAALAAAQQNAQNWQTLYSQMSSDLANQGVISQSTLDAARALYQTDAGERENALGTAAGLAEAGVNNAMEAYLGRLGSADTRYGYDTQAAMNTENNATQRYGYDTERDISAGQNAANIAMTGLSTEAQKAVAAMQAEAQKSVAATNAGAQMGVAGINANAQLGAAGISADAQKAIASINANASLNETMAQIQGELSLADLNNAAVQQQLLTQIAGNKELAAYDRDTQIKLAANAVKNTIKQKTAEYELAQQYGGGGDTFNEFQAYVAEAYQRYLSGELEKVKTWDDFKAAMDFANVNFFSGQYTDYLKDYFNMMEPDNKSGGIMFNWN